MKRFRELLNERWAAYTFAACSAVILYLLLGHIGNIGGVFVKIYKLTGPVLGGVVIAYLMDPLVSLIEKPMRDWFQNENQRHALAVAVAALLIVALFILLLIALVPALIDSVMTFVGNINIYVRTAERFINYLNRIASENNVDISGITTYGQEMLDSVLDILPNSINTIMTTSHSMGSSIINLIISFILAIYFLNGKEKIMNEIQRLRHAMYNDETYESRTKFFRRCNEIMLNFVIYDILDALIVAIANAVFMMVTGMSYAVLISVVVGVTNLAPTFGPIVGAVIGGLILVLVNPWHALFFLIFTIVLQTIDGYYIKPKLFGDQLGISGIWILICIIIGGRMFGATGVLFSIPFAAIADFAYKNEILARLELNKIRRQHAEAARASAHTAKDAAARGQLTSEIGSSGEESEV